MKAKDVKIGQHYLARVSSRLVTVRLDAVYEKPAAYGKPRLVTCYRVTNTATGRELVFRSAAKFRWPALADAMVRRAAAPRYSDARATAG